MNDEAPFLLFLFFLLLLSSYLIVVVGAVGVAAVVVAVVLVDVGLPVLLVRGHQLLRSAVRGSKHPRARRHG